LYLSGRRATRRYQASPFRFYQSIKRGCVLFAGLMHGTLPRNDVFHFLQAGRCLERAETISRIVQVKFQALAASAEAPHAGRLPLQAVHLTSLLRSCAAHESFLKTYHDGIGTRNVVQYLLLDIDFPRAVRYCVSGCLQSLHELAGRGQDGYGSEAERL